MKKEKLNKNNSSEKRKAIGLSVAATAVLLLGATLALFTSRTSSQFEATAGTVIIEVDNLFLTNATNINPGDNDPSNGENSGDGQTYVPGTPHTFTYELSSLGSKSTRTRTTILVTADVAGESTEALDASVFKLFPVGSENELFAETVIDEETGIVLEERTYLLSDGSEIKTLDELALVEEGVFVEAVRYFFIGDIFDGMGTSILLGGNAEKEDADNLIKVNPNTVLVTQNNGNKGTTYHTYDFGMMRGATNKYQGCDIQITVLAEGMQYRNTNDSDWLSATTVSQTFSTNAQLTAVPATNENQSGEELYPEEEIADRLLSGEQGQDELVEEIE